MADYKRLAALKTLCSLIEQEVGIKAYRGRQVVGTDIPLPFVVINEAIRAGDSRTVEEEARNNRFDRVDFLLSGYVKPNSVENPMDTAYEWIAKIEQAFTKIHEVNPTNGEPKYPKWYNLGNLVTKFVYNAPVAHNPPNEVQSNSYFYIYFSFHVGYDARNPYQSDN